MKIKREQRVHVVGWISVFICFAAAVPVTRWIIHAYPDSKNWMLSPFTIAFGILVFPVKYIATLIVQKLGWSLASQTTETLVNSVTPINELPLRRLLFDEKRKVLTEWQYQTVVFSASVLATITFFKSCCYSFYAVLDNSFNLISAGSPIVFISSVVSIFLAREYRKPFIIAEINDDSMLILRKSTAASEQVKISWNQLQEVRINWRKNTMGQDAGSLDFFDAQGKYLAQIRLDIWPKANIDKIIQFLRENIQLQDNRVLD